MSRWFGMPSAAGRDDRGRPHQAENNLAVRLDAAGISAVAALRDNGKTVTVSGLWRGQKVVAKVLTSHDPHWRHRHEREQRLYQRLAACPPPIRIPPLLHAQPGLTILGHLDGVMLAADRYPQQLDEADATRACAALDALHTWTPPDGLLGDPQPITAAYVDRLAAAASLTDQDRLRIGELLGSGPWAATPQHGDIWASNVLIDGDTVAFVDLEHMGLHVPGYDLAQVSLMWAVHHPTVERHVQRRVHEQKIQAPYAVNLILLACREWDIHHREGGSVFAETRPVLQANLHMAREYLHGRPLPVTGPPAHATTRCRYSVAPPVHRHRSWMP